jgi:hypothetical protein
MVVHRERPCWEGADAPPSTADSVEGAGAPHEAAGVT